MTAMGTSYEIINQSIIYTIALPRMTLTLALPGEADYCKQNHAFRRYFIPLSSAVISL
jgi:hypothetical protein